MRYAYRLTHKPVRLRHKESHLRHKYIVIFSTTPPSLFSRAVMALLRICTTTSFTGPSATTVVNVLLYMGTNGGHVVLFRDEISRSCPSYASILKGSYTCSVLVDFRAGYRRQDELSRGRS